MPNAVTGVHDGEEAIRYLSGEGPYGNRAVHPLPKLVVLDLRLSGMHGLEVLRWIRRQPALARLPVVMITGMKQPGDVERAHELGASGFLVKPTSFPKVLEMAQRLRDYWLQPVPQPNAREEVQRPG